MLGALSKSLATIVTQPLIVAKVGLQSKPPAARQGKPFKGFVEVMRFIIDNEGPMALFKGIGPQILKGLLVQGILMMAKERLVLPTPKTPNMTTDRTAISHTDACLGWSFSSSCSSAICGHYALNS